LLDRFRAPHFSLEMQCTGATDQFLRAFVQEMALGLGTIATARRLHRYRIGPLRVEHALMVKHCSLQNLLDNMALCR
jgi:tRNA U55 pseudouridine synthase TruB